jgi:hypothetical protein
MRKLTIDTHIYFPSTVFQQMKRLAEKNRRSMSAEIVIAVENHIALAEQHSRSSKQGSKQRGVKA